MIKKRRYKPIYKKLVRLRKNVNYNNKILTNFNRKKWKPLLTFLFRQSLRRKYRFRIFDQFNNFISRFFKFRNKKYLFNLLSKQRFNYFYGGIRRNTVKSIIILSKKLSKKQKLPLNRVFISLLENRLDTILYRAHFVKSIREARLLIKHKHVFINSNIVITNKHIVRPGDSITISETYKKYVIQNLKESTLWPIPPNYLYINFKLLNIVLLNNLYSNKFLSHFPFWLDINSVIHYYKY
jgi:ribosomal protein S4